MTLDYLLPERTLRSCHVSMHAHHDDPTRSYRQRGYNNTDRAKTHRLSRAVVADCIIESCDLQYLGVDDVPTHCFMLLVAVHIASSRRFSEALFSVVASSIEAVLRFESTAESDVLCSPWLPLQEYCRQVSRAERKFRFAPPMHCLLYTSPSPRDS